MITWDSWNSETLDTWWMRSYLPWITAGDHAAHEGHDIHMTSSLKRNGEFEQVILLYCIAFYSCKALPEAICIIGGDRYGATSLCTQMLATIYSQASFQWWRNEWEKGISIALSSLNGIFPSKHPKEDMTMECLTAVRSTAGLTLAHVWSKSSAITSKYLRWTTWYLLDTLILESQLQNLQCDTGQEFHCSM